MLIRRIAGSGSLTYRWHQRALPVAAILLILVVVGGMGPHLVHHLFEANHAEACLLFVQASHCPGLTPVGPSILLAHTMEAWSPGLPVPPSQIFLTVSNLPRAPPSTRA